MEEYVEKEKIKMYFAWFKKHNHLFKNIELDSNLIDEFFTESIQASTLFEENTKVDDAVYLSDEEEETVVAEDNGDAFFDTDNDEYHQTIEPDNHLCQQSRYFYSYQ